MNDLSIIVRRTGGLFAAYHKLPMRLHLLYNPSLKVYRADLYFFCSFGAASVHVSNLCQLHSQSGRITQNVRDKIIDSTLYLTNGRWVHN